MNVIINIIGLVEAILDIIVKQYSISNSMVAIES